MSREMPELPIVGLLSLAYNRLSQGIFASAADVEPEMRPSHGNVMEQIGREDGLRLTEIARRAGITPQSAGELVDQLERIGLVERRPDPEDRRAKRIYMTARGRRQAKAAMDTVFRQEREIQEILGPRRYRELRRSLDHVVEMAEGYAREPVRSGASS